MEQWWEFLCGFNAGLCSESAFSSIIKTFCLGSAFSSPYLLRL